MIPRHIRIMRAYQRRSGINTFDLDFDFRPTIIDDLKCFKIVDHDEFGELCECLRELPHTWRLGGYREYSEQMEG